MSCTEPRKQTHPVWVLKTLLDIIKADDDRQLMADRHDLEPRNMRACVCVRVRKRKEESICRNFTTNSKGYPACFEVFNFSLTHFHRGSAEFLSRLRLDDTAEQY